MQGKVALVTGSSGGIGRATALAFSRAGARVLVADVETEGGEETVRLIEGAGGEAAFVRADVSRTGDVEAMGTPEEIAAAAVWLCSDAASFVTGHAMAVDGGWVSQ